MSDRDRPCAQLLCNYNFPCLPPSDRPSAERERGSPALPRRPLPLPCRASPPPRPLLPPYRWRTRRTFNHRSRRCLKYSERRDWLSQEMRYITIAMITDAHTTLIITMIARTNTVCIHTCRHTLTLIMSFVGSTASWSCIRLFYMCFMDILCAHKSSRVVLIDMAKITWKAMLGLTLSRCTWWVKIVCHQFH